MSFSLELLLVLATGIPGCAARSFIADSLEGDPVLLVGTHANTFASGLAETKRVPRPWSREPRGRTPAARDCTFGLGRFTVFIPGEWKLIISSIHPSTDI